MSSAVQICNLALSHLDITKRIASFTEESEEARLLSVFYETTRDVVIKDRRWPFATKIATLGLVEEDPNDDWAYSYRYPSDCLAVRRILSGIRNDLNSTRTPYKIAYDGAGRIIFSDFELAQAEYTARITDPELFPPDFVMALSFRIAAYIAPALTSGDPFNLGDRAMNMYKIELGNAASNSFNEEQPDVIPESSLIAGRE